MKFEYKKFRIEPTTAFPDRKYLLRPIIPLKLCYESKKIGYEALLDSGADFSIFHAELGEYLGIDITSGNEENFGGIASRGATAYFHSIELGLGGKSFKSVPIGFSYDIAEHGYGILGHFGFFNIFRIIFDLKKEQIELREKK